MKRICILFISILLIFSHETKAQKEEAIAAGAAVIGAIGAGVAAVKQMEREAELKATEYFLDNYPEHQQFSMETLDFEGKKLKDLSKTSLITFKVQDFSIESDEPQLGKKFVLLGFTSFGWVSEYGIDFDKVLWFLIDEEEWLKMMTAYTKMASGKSNEKTIKEALRNGKIVNKKIKVKGGDNIDFLKLTDKMYLVTEYSPDMKFIYNEKALGIYLKESKNLVQIRRKAIINIHDYFFTDN